jgi:heterodisulfide reductase subunit A
MAVAKVALFEPLTEAKLEIDQNAVVIGGGVSGMSSARALSSQGYNVTLVERDDHLGGQAVNLYATAKGESIQDNLKTMISDVTSNDKIRILTKAELTAVDGFVGNFDSTVSVDGKLETIHHGVTVIATGASELKPAEYMYGQDPRVITGLELDRKFIANDPSLASVKSAVFIQCVGSREPERPYCSRICCTHSVASALHLKSLNPDMNIFVLYRDIRTYGEKEALYKEAREKGVIFIRYGLDNKPVVKSGSEGLEITVTDHVLKRPLLITADLVTLASAVVPYRDEKLAQFFKVPMNADGFFAEAHVKLAPSRSEERRVGKECRRLCRSRWSPYH